MPSTSSTIDYSQKWYVLSAVGMGVFLATIDGSIVNVSLPTMENSFQTDFALVQWVVLSYLLTVTTLMLGIGRLADIYGKKPIYTAGFIVFTIGSAQVFALWDTFVIVSVLIFAALLLSIWGLREERKMKEEI